MPDTANTTAAARPMELLAPAGHWESLQAALEAGADAVYFGLTTLNARRGAKNFRQEDFPRAVEAAHAKGARVYLTLNIDLTQRELGQTARILELARQSRVDAVLVRDPAIFALRAHFPELEFHFSTQTCMTSSVDVAAAGQLGAKRVVLAREMSLAEIAAASAVGVETEVFVQGSLCFCISGRCLLSSWVGGRSGNRGACTSPCRVPWTVDSRTVGTPLSMRDLATVHHLDELRKAGVRSLKIEGRLKTATWVSKAVALYRRALRGDDLIGLFQEVEALGTYTGRLMTSGFLDNQRDELTAIARGRAAASTAPATPQAEAPAESEGQAPGDADDGQGVYNLDVTIGEKSIVCRCEVGGRSVEWTLPKTVVRRQYKAVQLGKLLEGFGELEMNDCQPGNMTTNDPEFLLVPRVANAMVERVGTAVRQLRKAPDDEVRLDLPEPVRATLIPDTPSEANDLRLGEPADRVRLHAGALATFIKRIRANGDVEARPDAIIIEDAAPTALGKLVSHCPDIPLIVALPAVFFEAEVANVRELVRQCAAASLAVEVNSWGGWLLAKEAGVRMESGPGLAVLNSLAARAMGELGVGCVTLSVEADRRQLEEVTAHCPVPCSMIVYGRPPLVYTRVRLGEELAGKTFEDRRGVQITPRLERGLWVFRPIEPLDLRHVHNERIRVSHLVADLVAWADPASEWLRPPTPKSKPFRFNYNRSLA